MLPPGRRNVFFIIVSFLAANQLLIIQTRSNWMWEGITRYWDYHMGNWLPQVVACIKARALEFPHPGEIQLSILKNWMEILLSTICLKVFQPPGSDLTMDLLLIR